MNQVQKDFITRWGQAKFGTHWMSSPELTFWAASYQMPIQKLVVMSAEFMRLPSFRGSTTSSHQLAHKILMEYNDHYRQYGPAGLYGDNK